MKKPILLALLAAVAFAQEPVKRVTDAEELEQLIKKESNLFFLDVREPKEIEELGSMKGYVNIPIGELEKRLSEVPKDKTIITA
jgi:rhodanese-related sulfurtransferase